MQSLSSDGPRNILEMPTTSSCVVLAPVDRSIMALRSWIGRGGWYTIPLSQRHKKTISFGSAWDKIRCGLAVS